MTQPPAHRRAAEGITPAGNAAGNRQERHLRVGVSHPSGDPARHRAFDVRASYKEGIGWVADLAEENLNDQLRSGTVVLRGVDRAEGFPTAAACLGDAVAMLVRMVDGDAADEEPRPGAERSD